MIETDTVPKIAVELVGSDGLPQLLLQFLSLCVGAALVLVSQHLIARRERRTFKEQIVEEQRIQSVIGVFAEFRGLNFAIAGVSQFSYDTDESFVCEIQKRVSDSHSKFASAVTDASPFFDRRWQDFWDSVAWKSLSLCIALKFLIEKSVDDPSKIRKSDRFTSKANDLYKIQEGLNEVFRDYLVRGDSVEPPLIPDSEAAAKDARA